MANIFKKVYELDIEYITDNSNPAIDVRYEIDGNAVPGGGSSALGLNQTLSGTSDKDDVNILKLSLTSPVKCRSISFRISLKSAIGLSYFLPFGNAEPGLPTYKPKKAAPAPTMVDINIACALVGSGNCINQVTDL